MKARRSSTSQAFILALIIHGAALLVLGAYIAYTQSPPIKEWVASTFLKAQKEVKPKERPKELKPVVRPTIPTEQPMAVQQVQTTPRVTTAAVIRAPMAYATTEVLEFDNTPMVRSANVQVANAPTVRVATGVVTYAYVPTSTTEQGISFSAPVGDVGIGSAPTVGRGIVEHRSELLKVLSNQQVCL